MPGPLGGPPHDLRMSDKAWSFIRGASGAQRKGLADALAAKSRLKTPGLQNLSTLYSHNAPMASHQPAESRPPVAGRSLSRSGSTKSHNTSASSDYSENSSRKRRHSNNSQGSEANFPPARVNPLGRIFFCPVAPDHCRHQPFQRLQNCKNHVMNRHGWHVQQHPDWELHIKSQIGTSTQASRSSTPSLVTPSVTHMGGSLPSSPTMTSEMEAFHMANSPSPSPVRLTVPELRVNNTVIEGENSDDDDDDDELLLQVEIESQSKANKTDSTANIYYNPSTYAAYQSFWNEEATRQAASWPGFQGTGGRAP